MKQELLAPEERAVSQSQWESREMIDTLKQTVAKGATDAQFKMFIEVCKATGLNPFLKEIWFVPNVGVMAGRDGYLRIANDHPMFDGMSTTVERDDQGIPIKATCSVWRKDRAHPITCEAFYNEYKKASQVWTTYKSAMISKVAEVLALKRSFSINGVVTEEEIGEQKAQAQDAQQDTAQRRIKELSAPLSGGKIDATNGLGDNVIPAATIIELADSLDAPRLTDHEVILAANKGIIGIEQRESAKREEAAQALKSVGPPKENRKRGTISFKALDAYKEVKKALLDLVGDDHIYYDILKLSNVSHADELAAEQSKEVYKLMANTVIKLRNDKALRDELAGHHSRLLGRYMDVLGANGFESTEMLLAEATGQQVQAVLDDLKAAV